MILGINKKAIANLIFFIILFPLPILEQSYSEFDLIIKIAQILVVIICLIMCLDSFSINKYDWCLLVYCIYVLISTLIFFSSRALSLAHLVGEIIFPIVSIIVYFKLIKKNIVETIHYISLYYQVIITLNLILMIAFPRGLVKSSIGSSVIRSCWLFGSKNNIVYILPIILLFITADKLLNNISKMRFYFVNAMLMISAYSMGERRMQIGAGSSTAIVMIVVFVGIVVIDEFRPKVSKVILRFFSISNVTFFSLIGTFVLALISERKISISLLNRYLAHLGKNVRFSGRDTVWRRCMELIIANPIIGSPYAGNYYIYNRNYITTSVEYSFWLSVIVRFGIVGAIIIVLFFCRTSIEKNTVFKRVSQIAFLLIMMSGLVDTPNWKALILVVLMSTATVETKFLIDTKRVEI